MLSSRLFWKIFGSYAALTLAAALAFVAIQTGRQREIVVEQVRNRLHDSAVVLRNRMRDAFDEGANAELQLTLKQLGNENGTRLTLISADGTVIGDSAEDPAVMNNHGDREELLQAGKNDYGLSQRLSETIGIPMMYFALRLNENEKLVGFVRVAMPMESVNKSVASVQQLVWVTAITVSLVALVITYFIVGRIIQPLLTLTRSAGAIAGGDLHQQVEVPGRDELGTLADAFNLMSRELALRIDELQHKGEELAKNSERLETVLGGMIEGVIAVDGEEHILFANQAAKTLLEISASEIVGRPIWETVRNPAIQKVVRNAMEFQGQKHVELEIPRSHTVVAVLAARLPGNPCPGVVLVFHDVTDLRRLENVRRDFVSNVSHELKTPLTSIQAYAETLLAGAIDDPDHNRQFIIGIEEQAHRLHALILDLLHLSRIESGADVFEVSPVLLGEKVDSCLRQHAAVCDAKGITILAQPHVSSVNVLADPEGLQTILDNLVDNAINYTPDGGSVTVRWKTNGSTAVIEVEDTGIGIAREHRERIFERFYRVDKARSRELGGTGLGLSIVKHLVQEFGGSVDVTSHPGQGSTFTVFLPLAT